MTASDNNKFCQEVIDWIESTNFKDAATRKIKYNIKKYLIKLDGSFLAKITNIKSEDWLAKKHFDAICFLAQEFSEKKKVEMPESIKFKMLAHSL
jgi:hypothetical protein